jgi:hypothetical protein
VFENTCGKLKVDQLLGLFAVAGILRAERTMLAEFAHAFGVSAKWAGLQEFLPGRGGHGRAVELAGGFGDQGRVDRFVAVWAKHKRDSMGGA